MSSGAGKSSALDSSRRDILENQIYQDDPETLRLLLQDHSTGRNIRWATKDYLKCGVKGFGEWDSITIPSIIRKNGFVIQPRIDKSAAEQRARSVGKAEVFTPSWICNKQNNLVDAAWFGRKNAGFNDELDEKPALSLGMLRWQVRKQKINFPKRLRKAWLDYVRACRLEVACGEGPYLTSRYDTVTGEFISPPDRIGILDRKLRVVSENVQGETDWCTYAAEALKSVYGFEYQGDNVLIARENLLYAVKEQYELLFHKPLPMDFVRLCATVISWNVWQMDGLKFVVPGTCHDWSVAQLDLGMAPEMKPCPGCRANDPTKHNGIRCRVMDWSLNQAFDFVPPFEHFKE